PHVAGHPREALTDEQILELVVDDFIPQVTVGAAVVADGDGGERLADDEPRVVVRPGFVVVIALCGVIVGPGRETGSRLRQEAPVESRHRRQPVVGERHVRPVPAHRITSVVRDGDDYRRRRRTTAPTLPISVYSGDTAELVAERLIVLE